MRTYYKKRRIMPKPSKGSGLKLSGSGIVASPQGSGYAGSGLKLSGSGCQMGEGWRTGIGATLVSIGGITGAGAINEGNLDQGIGSALFIGMGSAMIAAEKIRNAKKKKKRKKRKAKEEAMEGQGVVHSPFMSHLKKFLKANPHHIVRRASAPTKKGGYLATAGSGAGIVENKHVHDFLQKHKNRKMDMKQIFGSKWKEASQKLLNVIDKAEKMHNQGGDGILGKIGKATKGAIHKMKKFARGDMKFKPSDYFKIAGKVLKLEGRALGSLGIPFASMIGSAADIGSQKYASHLKKKGMGEGSGIKPLTKDIKPKDRMPKKRKIPKKYINFLIKNPEKAELIKTALRQQKGSGVLDTVKDIIKIGGTLLALWKFIKSTGITWADIQDATYSAQSALHFGQGHEGSGLPQKVIKYISKNPLIARHMAVLAKRKEQYGGGKASKFVAALGLTATGAAAGAYGFYTYLLNNPTFAAKIVAKGGKQAVQGWLGGQGHEGQGVFKKIGKAIKKESKKIDKYYHSAGLHRFPVLNSIEHVRNIANLAKGIAKGKNVGHQLAKFGTKTADTVIPLTELESIRKSIHKVQKRGKKAKKGEGLTVSGGGLTVSGGASKMPYGCVSLPNGKMKCNKYSVWHGHHKKTRGGLAKSDLMMKGKRVISRRKHEQGIRMWKQGKGIYS